MVATQIRARALKRRRVIKEPYEPELRADFPWRWKSSNRAGMDERYGRKYRLAWVIKICISKALSLSFLLPLVTNPGKFRELGPCAPLRGKLSILLTARRLKYGNGSDDKRTPLNCSHHAGC